MGLAHVRGGRDFRSPRDTGKGRRVRGWGICQGVSWGPLALQFFARSTVSIAGSGRGTECSRPSTAPKWGRGAYTTGVREKCCLGTLRSLSYQEAWLALRLCRALPLKGCGWSSLKHFAINPQLSWVARSLSVKWG